MARVDTQCVVVKLLRCVEVWGLGLAQAVANQVVPFGAAGVIDTFELFDRTILLFGFDLGAYRIQLVLRFGRRRSCEGAGHAKGKKAGTKDATQVVVHGACFLLVRTSEILTRGGVLADDVEHFIVNLVLDSDTVEAVARAPALGRR